MISEEPLAVGVPMVLAAKQLLRPRIDCLRHALEELQGLRRDDPEPIHNLRVATRRCAVAIHLLGLLIPRDLRRPLLQQLKHLRRECGPSRDLDIQRDFYEQLLSEVETQDLAVIDLLYERVSERREKQQRRLLEELSKRRKKLERRCAEVLVHLDLLRKRPPDLYGPLGETALPLLLRLLQRVCDAAPSCDASPAELHQLRIAGKKLRYACELFEPLLGTHYPRELAPRLVALQDALGQYHDSQVASEQLAQLRSRWKRKRHQSSWDSKPQGLFSWRELSSGLRFVAHVHAEGAAAARDRFFHLWPGFATTEFRQPLEARLSQLSASTETRPKSARSPKKVDRKFRRPEP